MSTPEVEYGELTATGVNEDVIADINRLLPQLTSEPKPINQAWLRKVLASGTRIFTASHNSRIIGTVLLSPMLILVGQKDWIEDVVVDAAYQRRGIASKLMDIAEQASRARHAKSVNLTSHPDRNGAREMYGKRGYKLRETGVFRLTH